MVCNVELKMMLKSVDKCLELDGNCGMCSYQNKGCWGTAGARTIGIIVKELAERRAQGKNGSLEAKYTPIEYMGDKAYMRTCPVCGDLVVIRPKTMGLENYCRNCATRLKPYKEEQEE